MNILNWNEKFMLIDKHKPTDLVICKTFNISPAELNTARELRSTGVFDTPSKFDISKYDRIFTHPVETIIQHKTTHNLPIFATKQTVHKQPGRKGSKIADAFKNVPFEPVDVEVFARDNNVSISILRQSKRFVTDPKFGNVIVRKDKSTNLTMIWREV